MWRGQRLPAPDAVRACAALRCCRLLAFWRCLHIYYVFSASAFRCGKDARLCGMRRRTTRMPALMATPRCVRSSVLPCHFFFAAHAHLFRCCSFLMMPFSRLCLYGAIPALISLCCAMPCAMRRDARCASYLLRHDAVMRSCDILFAMLMPSIYAHLICADACRWMLSHCHWRHAAICACACACHAYASCASRRAKMSVDSAAAR